MFRRGLAENGHTGIEVLSAGTGAWEGALASEGAYLVGLEHGLDISGHRARLLTREVVHDADLVLTMARHHRVRAQELGGDDRTFVLGEYVGLTGPEAEVRDPFGSELEVYRSTYEQLDELIGKVLDRFCEEHGYGDQRA